MKSVNFWVAFQFSANLRIFHVKFILSQNVFGYLKRNWHVILNMEFLEFSIFNKLIISRRVSDTMSANKIINNKNSSLLYIAAIC